MRYTYAFVVLPSLRIVALSLPFDSSPRSQRQIPDSVVHPTGVSLTSRHYGPSNSSDVDASFYRQRVEIKIWPLGLIIGVAFAVFFSIVFIVVGYRRFWHKRSANGGQPRQTLEAAGTYAPRCLTFEEVEKMINRRGTFAPLPKAMREAKRERIEHEGPFEEIELCDGPIRKNEKSNLDARSGKEEHKTF